MIFQLDVVHNLPSKLPQKSLYEKLLLFAIHTCCKSSKRHKMMPSALLGYRKSQIETTNATLAVKSNCDYGFLTRSLFHQHIRKSSQEYCKPKWM